MKISKDFEFAAAHKLTLPYNSPCERLHGHNYKLKITLQGEINKCGMIMDFKELKSVVVQEVISLLDHQDLTNFFDNHIGHINATVEIMAKWIYHRLEQKINMIYSVTLWETTDSSAEYP